MERLEGVERLFSEFGPTNPWGILESILEKILPKFITKHLKFLEDMIRRNHEFFHYFDKLYSEHEETYNPEYKRDFIDIYISERKRVEQEDLKHSSFYGDLGKLNYRNAMFDLFLVSTPKEGIILDFGPPQEFHFRRAPRRQALI